MSATLEQIRNAFLDRVDKQANNPSTAFNEELTEIGYMLSQQMGVCLSHYEYPGRNDRLEYLFGYLCIESHLSFYQLQWIEAIHDHKGWLRVKLRDDILPDVHDWFSALRYSWDRCGEDPDAVMLYHDGNVYEPGSCVQWADDFYQGIRYELDQETD